MKENKTYNNTTFEIFYNNYKILEFEEKARFLKDYAKKSPATVSDIKKEIVKKEKEDKALALTVNTKSYNEFYTKLMEQSKIGKVGNIDLFYDYATTKYLYTRTEKIIDENGKIEVRKILDFYEEKAVKRLILEQGKKEIGELIEKDIVIQATQWLPSYIKGYSPHRPLIYDDNVKNMCVLPEHLKLYFEDKITKEDLHSKIIKLKNINLLLNNLFVKEEYKHYFLNWLSFIVQTKRKTRNAIVLVGEQGTGKGNLKDYILTWFFGDENCVEAGNRDIRSEFNHIFDNRMFVFFNEIKADQREGNTVYESMKPLITDPTFMVNMKNVAQYQTQNHFNTMLFSNHEVPLQVEGSDRRYSIFKTASTKIESLVDDLDLYIKGLKDERESFLNLLLSFKYDKDLVFSLVYTDQKNKIVELSNTKKDLMQIKISNKDTNYFEDSISDLIEGKENDKEIKEFKYDGNIREPIYFENNNEEMKKEFLNNLNFGAFRMETLKWFYKLSINDVDNNGKISKFWNYIFDDTVRLGDKKATVKMFKNCDVVVIDNIMYKRYKDRWIKDIPIVYEDIDKDSGMLLDKDGKELF
jgi:hypothetical protein